MKSLIAASMGLILGSFGAGLPSLFLWLTRSHRKVGNLYAIHLGKIVVGVSSVLPLFVLIEVSDRLNLGHGTPQGDAALYAYTASFILVTCITLRSEWMWRKSVGLNRKKPM